MAGLAGLLLAQDPTLNPDEVELKITSTAEDVSAATLPGEDNQLGAGRINVFSALSLPPPTQEITPTATITFSYDANGNTLQQAVSRFQGNTPPKITFPNNSTSTYTYDGLTAKYFPVDLTTTF